MLGGFLLNSLNTFYVIFPKYIVNQKIADYFYHDQYFRTMTELFMKWEPAFNLGLTEIDEQHKRIVAIINQLNQAILDQESDEKIDQILAEMSDYADYHFKTEEGYFHKHHFPLIDDHILQHKKFIDKVADFRKKYEDGQAITFQLMNYLKSWLSNHILDADREYVDLIKSEINVK